jgi:hypothetical protein
MFLVCSSANRRIAVNWEHMAAKMQFRPYLFRFPCDTEYSTMHRKKLDKIKREIAAFRRSPQKATALERLARQLGRKKVKRGKEPVWENQELTELYPLAIPHHGTRDLSIGTQRSILDALEDDVLAWEERLTDEEYEENENAEPEEVDSDDDEGGNAE